MKVLVVLISLLSVIKSQSKYYCTCRPSVRRGRDRMVVGFTTTCAISTNNHLCCEFELRLDDVYSIQHYMITFVSDLRQVGGFHWVLRFLPPIQIDHHDIIEIVLKLALSTINQTTL